MWKTTIHVQAVELDGPLRASIEQQIVHALAAGGRRIEHVHVRLYGEAGGAGVCTCYVRVDLLPGGGIAAGETAGDVATAVARTMERIAVAVRNRLEQRPQAAPGAATAILVS
ncbi:MAG TPA: hypothetical protein VFE68_14240 [Vicinamibacteria bacterium]|nr:hypothetical protein [Vicinamibacteria bacterium]